MSRAEQKIARIQQLREKAKARKEAKKQEQQKQIWDQVSEGSSIEDSDEETHVKGDLLGNHQESADSEDKNENSDDDILVPVKKQHVIESEDDDKEIKPKELKVKAKKLKKITKEGPFDGKNR